MTRAISVVAVIVCLTGYNTVLDKRELAEEVERLHRAVGTLSCRYAVDEEQLMERIRLPEEGRDVVRSLKMTEQEYHRW